MKKINPAFPVLTIAGCALEIVDYEALEQAMAVLKTSVIGNPQACMHFRDIRKWERDFAHIVDKAQRKALHAAISTVVAATRFSLISVSVKKDQFERAYALPRPPYELAVEYLLERYFRLLSMSGMTGGVHVESRGRKEDRLVAGVYERFRADGFAYGTAAEVQARLPLPITFGAKSDMCAGLELADLVAYPVARHVMEPTAPNPAFEVIKPKLYAGNRPTVDYSIDERSICVGGSYFVNEAAWQSRVSQYGLKVFP